MTVLLELMSVTLEWCNTTNETKFSRPEQCLICKLHANELSFRQLFPKLESVNHRIPTGNFKIKELEGIHIHTHS